MFVFNSCWIRFLSIFIFLVLAYLNTGLHVAGGWGGGYLKSAECYDQEGDKWKDSLHMNERRVNAGMLIVKIIREQLRITLIQLRRFIIDLLKRVTNECVIKDSNLLK